jgi:hypothetical protein
MFPPDWRTEKTTVDEAEADHPGLAGERVKRFPEAAKPFGFQNAEWEVLKAEIQPGDELWRFVSPPESWKHLAGSAGVALVRRGAIIRSIVTLMN